MLFALLVCVLGNVASTIFVHNQNGDGSPELSLEILDAIPEWAAPGSEVKRIIGTDVAAARDKVAILTSGTVQRYFLGHATKGLIEPLVQQGHAVDYYLTLNAASFQSFRANADKFVSELNGSISSIDQLIRLRVSEHGGTIRHLEISDGVRLNEDDEKFVRTSSLAGVRNLVNKYKKQEAMWLRLEDLEKHHGRYTTVIVVNDDSIWFKPFDLDRLRRSSDRLSAEGYVIDCSKVTRGIGCCSHGSNVFNDYIEVLDREVAEPFGKSYSFLIHDPEYKTVLSDEELIGRLAQRHNFTLHRRPAGLIPMQRGGQEKGKSGKAYICLHKVCDGEWTHGDEHYSYLKPTDSMKLCKSAQWLAPKLHHVCPDR